MFEGIRCVFDIGTLLTPIYIYCFLKLIFPIFENDEAITVIFILLLRISVTVITTPLALTTLIFFGIFSDIIRLIGRILYYKTFVDYALGGDAMYSKKGVIPAVYYIEEKSSETASQLMAHFKKRTQKAQQNHPRLQCIHKVFLGYVFFLREETIGLDFITYFKDYKTDEEFRERLNEKLGSSLPANNNFLWDITIGKSGVTIQEKKCIPVVFRLHHSLGDGVTLMTLLMSNYADNGTENIKLLCDTVQNITKNNSSIKRRRNSKMIKETRDDNYMNKMFNKFTNFIWNKEYFFNFDITESYLSNSLHCKASGEVSLVMNNDIQKLDANGKNRTVEKMKIIKTKLNVSFNDVFLGLLGGSLTRHFIKRKDNCPKEIVILNPYNLKAGHFNELLTFNKRNEPITNLGNKITAGIIPIPVREKLLKKPKQFILEQNKFTRRFKSSLDFRFMYWMFNKLIPITPLPIIAPVNKLYDPSMLVTNLPSLAATKIFGHDMVDMTLSTVHDYDVTACVTLYTYRNIFHISTFIDKSFISYDEQNAIYDNFIELVNQIYEECI